jgi:hypothetical protein
VFASSFILLEKLYQCILGEFNFAKLYGLDEVIEKSMVLQKNKYENHIYNKKFGKEPHSSG